MKTLDKALMNMFGGRPIEGQDYHKMLGGNLLICRGSESFIMFLNDMDEFITVQFWDLHMGYIVRKWPNKASVQGQGCYLIKQYQDWIFPKYIDKQDPKDYVYDTMDEVVKNINKYLYEVV
jgi:hypothetical protein